METITSRTNPLMTHIRKLTNDRKYRRTACEMVCEGPKMLEEALRWRADIHTIVFCRGAILPKELPNSVRRVEVSEELLKSVAPTQTPQKLLFLCALPCLTAGEGIRQLLVLDGLQDPGNVGTLWRTADAFGADGLYLLPSCADPWNPKTIRATMGACFRLPVREGSQEELMALRKEQNLPLYATALRENTMDIRSIKLDRAAVVIGSEGRGVSESILQASDLTLNIPMTDRCESLNAASAGTVVLWQMMAGREGTT